MADSVIGKDVRDRLDMNISKYDPRLRRLEAALELAKNPHLQFSELSFDEAIDWGILQGLNDKGVVELPVTMAILNNVIANRHALDRARVGEFLKALVGVGREFSDAQALTTYGNLPLEEEQKPGIFRRFFNWALGRRKEQ